MDELSFLFQDALEPETGLDLAEHEEVMDDFLEQEEALLGLLLEQPGAGNNITIPEGSGTSRKRKAREEEPETVDLGAHMVVTPQEREWALALKAALLGNEETKSIPITDMDIVQFGIVESGNISNCLVRIKHMHEFRTRYGIEDTVEHGLACAEAFMEQQPGFLLNIDQSADQKHYVQVMDMQKFRPGRVVFDKDWKVFLSGLHYFMVALNPTLAAVRNGIVGIAECDGMGWDNFCMEFERRLWYEHPTAYPAIWYEVSWVRPPTAANMLFSLLKPIMPEKIRNAFRLGVQFDDSFDGRLDTLFLQPSIEVAMQRQLWTLQSFWAKRFHNQAHFRL